MEVWFFYQEGTTAERPTHATKNQKGFTPALLRSALGELLPADRQFPAEFTLDLDQYWTLGQHEAHDQNVG